MKNKCEGNHTFQEGMPGYNMPQHPSGVPYYQYYLSRPHPLGIYQMQADLEKVKQERHDDKEFQEIYKYVKKREKKKYKEKIEKLIKQVKDMK